MNDQTVIVSGGTGGLGTAVVNCLTTNNYHLVVPYRTDVDTSLFEHEDRITFIQADTSHLGDIARLVQTLRDKELPPLHALVNLVGGFDMAGNIAEAPYEVFDSMLKLNTQSLYLLSQAVLPEIVNSGSGSIVTVASQAVKQPFAGAAGYIASKAAVLSLTESLFVEYKNHGIRSNSILPGVIDTPTNRRTQPEADVSSWTTPKSIAEVIVFLLSREGAAINGAQIPVHPVQDRVP